MKWSAFLIGVIGVGVAMAETKPVYLEDAQGVRTQVATINFGQNGGYEIEMFTPSFSEHFLSMRPFKCLEGPDKQWCHVPYPYEIARNISADLTDLEYDMLFIWKGSTEYGINPWNGVYYRITPNGDGFAGAMHEVDMDILAVPPDAGELRPLKPKDLHEADPESHWLPKLVID